MHIVITDCDHDSVAIERDAVEAAGGRLTLCQDITPEGIIDNARDAQGLIVQYGRITDEVLSALPELRVVSRYGVGVDTVDVEAATRHGVAVCNVPDYGTEAVSDHAITLALAVLRDVTGLDRRLREGQPSLGPAQPIFQLRGRRFGVVGAGAIGMATAHKAAGLGFEVMLSDPRLTPGETTPEGFTVVSFEDLLALSQVVSLHLPLIEQTHHLIDAAALGAMREDAILINTARGGVVDTEALVEALSQGRLMGAGLDVLEEEPLAVDHPLTRLERVILTPHAGFYTEESYAELKARTVQNAVDVIAGRRPRNILNPEVLHG
ncbi:C-terminal binding protein [Kushneria konosiri]|uniref:2-hydroxyacid dehydrogenase n=1 Tax=Kushneria konosiri TaxID=698828 RepID=A0A2Z2H6D0_9GAMM|nr:C-terminal binding protein [Kushneria konosiri]ARS52959.1 2-hydroxyacid dehydrogenase [Kushneria konosiri]